MDGFFPASFIPELSERMGWILLTAGGAAVMRQGRRNDIGKRRIAGKGREAEAQNEAAEAGFADAALFNEFADVDLWHGNAPRSFLMYFPPKRAPQRGFPAFFRLHMVLLYQAPLPNATKNFPRRAGRPAWLGKG